MSDNNDIISIANEIATQKENIRKAIVAQGVTCPESTPLNQYPGKIANINGVTTVPNTIWHDNNITSATTTYTVPAGVGIVGGRIFDDNRAVLESVDFNSAIAVTENTCCDCTSLTNVTGINAKYIGENAFHNCYNLTSLESNSLEYVADKAFRNCYNVTSGLETVNCPNVVYAGVEAFNNNQLLQSVSLPACTELGAGAFRLAGNQSWTTKNIHITYNLSNVEKIGYEGIYNNVSLQTINLPKVKDLGIRCFGSCEQLASVTAPLCENVKDSCFYDTALTTITAPNIKSVGISSFEGTTHNTLANVNGSNQCNLPECEYVGTSAFYDNTNFTSLTLADGCVIGDNAFALSSGESNETLNNAYIRPSSIGRLAFGRRIIPYGIDFSLCTYIATGAFNGRCDYNDGLVPVRILPQGLDFSSMKTFDLSNCEVDIPDYSRIFNNIGSSSSKVKVWMPKTATISSTDNGYIFNTCYLDIYTDAASSSELGTYAKISREGSLTYHWGTTHKDFLNA